MRAWCRQMLLRTTMSVSQLLGFETKLRLGPLLPLLVSQAALKAKQPEIPDKAIYNMFVPE